MTRPAGTGWSSSQRTSPTKAERRLKARQDIFDRGGSELGVHPNKPIPGTRRPGSLNRRNS